MTPLPDFSQTSITTRTHLQAPSYYFLHVSDTADESTGDLLSRLSSRLSEAHDQAMRALQPSVDASVLEASEEERQQQAASLRQTLTSQEPLSQGQGRID